MRKNTLFVLQDKSIIEHSYGYQDNTVSPGTAASDTAIAEVRQFLVCV